MRVPEGNALYNEIIGGVRRVCKALDRAEAHHVLAECDRGQHAGEERNAGLRRVDRIEGRLLVLLHILVVGEGKALHCRKKRHQIAVHSAGLAAHKFTDIRILLLRHNAAAGGEGVVHLHKPVFVGIPGDELLAEPAQVHHDQGEICHQFDQVIPVRYGIHAVEGRTCKSQQGGRHVSVQWIGRPGQRAGSQGTIIHS